MRPLFSTTVHKVFLVKAAEKWKTFLKCCKHDRCWASSGNCMWKSHSVKNEPKLPFLAADAVNQAADRIVENTIFLYQRVDLVVRVHHRRVMLPAELPADLRITVIR